MVKTTVTDFFFCGGARRFFFNANPIDEWIDLMLYKSIQASGNVACQDDYIV
jgi:hypothetical protein